MDNNQNIQSLPKLYTTDYAALEARALVLSLLGNRNNINVTSLTGRKMSQPEIQHLNWEK